MDGTVVLQALFLVLVVEGIPLFLAPGRMRAAAAMLIQTSDRYLRVTGLVFMVLGAGMIFVLSR